MVFMIFEGNARTKQSYLHMSIPLRHIIEGINAVLGHKNSMFVIVEIVNDGEFAAFGGITGQKGYAVAPGKKGSKIIIPEEHVEEFTSLSVRGFIDIYYKLHPFVDKEKLHRDIIEEIAEIRGSVPKLQPSPATTNVPERTKQVEPGLANGGVRISFYTLIIKIFSLETKYPGGYGSFLKDTKSYLWQSDGNLLRMVAMNLGDFSEVLDMLNEKGLQRSMHPVDYYLLCKDPFPYGEDILPFFLSTDDGEIECFFDEDGQCHGRLKNAGHALETQS